MLRASFFSGGPTPAQAPQTTCSTAGDEIQVMETPTHVSLVNDATVVFGVNISDETWPDRTSADRE